MDNSEVQKSKEIPTRHTRWTFLLAFAVLTTLAWLLSLFGVIETDRAVSYNDWTQSIMWAFGVYSASEVGAKASHAVLNK